ncbi:hypothetical protein VTN77DRAFT_3736 [Rasamsonia byssochlamydoides]|uniref:uncharacterized protein n=1 Tax=Rasamsonia byssochlamydoides TaxID=89139 RepID=UPI0037448071
MSQEALRWSKLLGHAISEDQKLYRGRNKPEDYRLSFVGFYRYGPPDLSNSPDSLDPPDPPEPAKSTTQKQWTTRDERIRIHLMRDLGYTYKQIASYIGLSIRQVQYACSIKDPAPKKPPGRRSQLSEAQLDAVEAFLRASEENRRMSYKKIIEALNLGVKGGCLALALKRRGYSRGTALRKPPK